MNRNSGNVSKTKKLISGVSNNSKHNRKSLQKLSDSSSISSNRNSSANSEEDVRVTNVYLRPQLDNNVSLEEHEQLMRKLQGQVKELRHKLRVLEESVDSKDYSLGAIAREKDRAVGEIRRLERTNKQLRQQLNDERNHYLEEKEKFCEQMTKYKKKLQETKPAPDKKKSPLISKQSLISQSLKWQQQKSKEKGDFVDSKSTNDSLRASSSQKMLGSTDKKSIQLSTFSLSDCQVNRCSSIERLRLYEGDDVSLQMAALRTENARLRSIICERDERNYELCLRFLRMKHYKNDIRSRFQDLENEYLQVIANLMDKIDEARQEFNFIIDQKFKRPLHSTNAMYLQMVQKNSRMAFENASLRLENQCLKKELNKHMSSTTEFDRRNDSRPTGDELKSSEKVKRIKKNVNFNEIQTIYERELRFKNSDTDSNYMSKSSTTGPSNASLGDPKSNESITKDEEGAQDKNQTSFQANSLPNEILNKIFKRIDSTSSQTTPSARSKEQVNVEEASETKSQKKSIKNSEDTVTKTVDKEPIIIERKSPLKITDSSSPSESKESIRFSAKEATAFPLARTKAPEKEERKNKNQELRWTFKNRFKYKPQAGWLLDKSSEYGKGRIDFHVRKFILPGGGRSRRQEKTQRPSQDSASVVPAPESRPKQHEDCCGLQEKLEFSDLEFPSTGTVENPTEALDESREKPVSLPTAAEMIECEGEEEEEGGRLQKMAPAIGSRSRSTNKMNLHDELVQAGSRRLLTGERIRGKESEVQESRSRAVDLNNLGTSVADSAQETIKNSPKGSKRFSHRLISTSPELLRNILTESQVGSFKMAPVIVSHATTAITPAFNGETNGKILLQLIIPPTNVEQPTPTYSSHAFPTDATNKATAERETSSSSINPAPTTEPVDFTPRKSTTQVYASASSLPTSNSTMEMIDSAAFEWSNIMMRTLSAPGLLESNWLEPYNVCEMRDCGTNT